ncbi:serine hydrolase [Geodermatophilus marinus]|uniref:serine hydrolase n=1 Tax=Geodermatophilus sp. LHW52908 TaxID=2303986 RepID=UPI000E3BA9F7|nr:serine hydrolase [Geodermatophilus sp. LHW52908]RFU20732.1 LppW family protein [Geodermatophilus sp. LHW52908]
MTAARRLRRPGSLRRGGLVLALLLPALLATALVLPERRASAGELVPADAVPAITAAYGAAGALAVVVAPQLQPAGDLPERAAEARAVRALAAARGNDLADRPFPTASMVKLFLAEQVLHRARTGQVGLTDADRARLERMITRSDDPAASAVWVQFDGAQAVQDVARRYGLLSTTPPAERGQWGETYTTAADLARFMALLPVVAHPDDAATLLGWMQAATPIAADGFDQQFGVFGTVPGTPAVKQGWMCCVGGTRHLHSLGVFDGQVVVLLSEVPRSTGYAAARAALDTAAAAMHLST